MLCSRLILPSSSRTSRLCDNIERTRGLVGHEQRGPVEQSHHNENSLCLAYADLPRETPQEALLRRKSTGGQQLLHACAFQSPTLLRVCVPSFSKLRADTKRRIQCSGGALRNQTDKPAAHIAHLPLSVGNDVYPVHEALPTNLCAGVAQETQQSEGKRAFPRSAFADQAEDLPGVNLNVNAAQHFPFLRVIDPEFRGERGVCQR